MTKMTREKYFTFEWFYLEARSMEVEQKVSSCNLATSVIYQKLMC